MLKKSGEPVGATCTCVAGLGEACTHIARLLFGIEDFVSRGFKGLPDAQATTEKLCKWIVPRGPKVEPKALREVSVEKNVSGRLKKEKQFHASDYNPLPEKLNSVNYDSLSLLHPTLSLELPNLPWVKAVAPAVVKQHKPQKLMVVPPAKPTLPDIVNEFHPELVPSQCLKVRTDTRPMTLIEKIHSLNCDRNGEEDILQKLYKIDELMTMESLTRAQSDSVHWFQYRHGMITASNFQRVSSHVSVIKKRGTSEATQSLIDVLVTGGLFKGNAATRYGKKEEPKAIIVIH
ncbi:hypothetical protein DPMN_014749 [Dreissena polymorpha]|uniref:SWIM-type domain-containing protein n=1 Tax=Dreissena polymorpha TaxID=45954 RepID=A0A9D4NBE1_DREPO|nr:hypothetical protein DPMN_014749 [Dreissena polymorpha]